MYPIFLGKIRQNTLVLRNTLLQRKTLKYYNKLVIGLAIVVGHTHKWQIISSLNVEFTYLLSLIWATNNSDLNCKSYN